MISRLGCARLRVLASTYLRSPPVYLIVSWRIASAWEGGGARGGGYGAPSHLTKRTEHLGRIRKWPGACRSSQE